MEKITRCTRCIMDDSSDGTIRFDKDGCCNYCSGALALKDKIYFPNETGRGKMESLLAEIKERGKGKKYDCVMGLSGGLDSSYLAYLGHEWDLRILAVHIDDGFDTEISRENIRKLADKASSSLELMTLKPDPAQYNALIKAYMKAGVPNLAVPQDNIIFASLHDCARKYGVRYFLSGGNFALESILQRGNTYNPYDVTNIRDIHKRFGEQPISKLIFISRLRMVFNEHLLKLRTIYPLNYVDYNRERAFKELGDFCGFEYYGRKHLENILTAFIQLCWFPRKFGVDKRTSHLSSMIVSGQMTRDEALAEFALPLYDERMIADYIAVIKKGLGISDAEFDGIMSAPPRQHTEYRTDNPYIYKPLSAIYKMLRKL